MNMDDLARQALDTAKSITGKDEKDPHTQEIARMLACAVIAEELASRQED